MSWIGAATFIFILALQSSTAQLAVIQVQTYKTIVHQNTWYDVCITGRTDAYETAPACVDGDPSTICHSNTYGNRQWLRADLQEEFSITNVQLRGRPNDGPSYTRDDITQVWVGSNDADPAAAGNVQCVFPPPFTTGGAIRDFSCPGAAARFVFLLNSCATSCILNPAEIYIFAQRSTLPRVYVETAFGKPGFTKYPYGGTQAGQAAGAVDGSLSSLMHTAQVSNDYLWAWYDLGSALQPIDRIFVQARAHINGCIRYYERDNALNLAVSNDTTTLANMGATPAGSLCGSLPDPIPTPWSWYGADCGPRLARYVWVRQAKYWTNWFCNFAGSTCYNEYFIQFSELQVFSSRCPSMHTFVNTAAVTLANEFSSGCGTNTGNAATAVAWTGSRCKQTCAAGRTRLFGGSDVAAAECRVGEWVSLDTQTSGGPLVCGYTCPPRPAPALSIPSSCRQVVARNNFNSGTQSISDWYPTYRVYKAFSSSALAITVTETRAQIWGGVLTLSGYPTVWAVNDPWWASWAQTSNWLSVTASVRLGSSASCAGLVLRLVNTNPASYYLLRLRNGHSSHTFSRVNNGVEAVLGSTRTGVCTISTSDFQRIVFRHEGTTLSATCNGVDLGSVTDASAQRLVSGSAGLFSAMSPISLSGTSTFDDFLAERGCDGPNGGCNSGIPGNECIMQCDSGMSITVDQAALSTVCGASGAWSAPDLQCVPKVQIVPPFNVDETAPTRANIGIPLQVSPLPDGAIVNYTVVSTQPPGGPFTIGSCDGQLRRSQGGHLDYESGIVSFNVTIEINMMIQNVPTISRVNVTITVRDVNEPPALADTTITIPENAPLGSSYGLIQCIDVDGFPLRTAITVNSPDNLFNISAPLGAQMPAAGQTRVVVARNGLDFEHTRTYTLLITCTDSLLLSASAFLNIVIQDVQEPPVFHPLSLNVSIPEDAIIGQGASPALSAWDPENNTITFSLASPNAYFNVLPSGAIVAAAALDYEVTRSYALHVRATDSTGLSVTAITTVSVIDVNEFPIFVNQNRSVLENASVLSPIGQPLLATDPERDVLTFEIISQQGNLFTVDNPSGQLRLAAGNVLDFFVQRQYSLVVNVTDAGTPDGIRRTSTAQVAITVNWTNSPPKLQSYIFNISENAALNTVVGAVMGVDRDMASPILDTLSYSIVSQESTAAGDLAPFSVDNDGLIRVAAATSMVGAARLDYETKRRYILQVRASDRFGGSVVNSVQVNIQNMNEPPLLPNGIVLSARSRSSQNIGAPLSALVLDEDKYAEVGETWTFAFANPAENVDNTFQIDTMTGQLSVANPNAAAFFAGTTYTLSIRVRDAGINGAQLSSVTTITIQVIDNNQVPTCSAQFFSVAERSTHGTLVGTVTCSDPDQPQQTLNYRLDAAGPNANRPFPFRVDTVNSVGRVTVDTSGSNGEVDYEGAFRSYNATITVTDSHATFPLSASAALVIYVTDVAEAPYFATGNKLYNPGLAGAGNRTVEISELAPAGTEVFGSPILAWDQDVYDAAALAYSFDSSTPAADRALFTLHPSTGQLALASAGSLDFETRPQIMLRVAVRDSTSRTDVCNITVKVTDANEPPYLMSPPFVTSSGVNVPGFAVPENVTTPYRFGKLRAMDYDTGAAGQLSYGLTSVVSLCANVTLSSFSVDPISGNISVVEYGALDWEDCTAVTLNISVVDSGTPPRAIFVAVPITILDSVDMTIVSMRLVAGEEALGRGVDVQDIESPLASKFAYSTSTQALLSTTGGARILLQGRGLGLTAARHGREGAPPVAVSATYGPPGSIGRYQSSCSVAAQGTSVVCTAAPGVGSGHEWALTINGLTVRSGAARVTSYLPPSILNVSKTLLPGADPMHPDNHLISTTGGDTVVVYGSNMGPIGAIVELRYGPLQPQSDPASWQWSTRTPPCAWSAFGTSVICTIGAGVGGRPFGFQLVVDSQESSLFSNSSVAYKPPSIINAAGSPFDTRGGSQSALNISGANFGPSTSNIAVLASMDFGNPAAPVLVATGCRYLTSHSLVTCFAPPGVGQNLQLRVIVGAQESAVFLSSLRYKVPVLSQVSGPGAIAAQTIGGQDLMLQMDFVGPVTVEPGADNTGVGLWLPLVQYGRLGAKPFQATACKVMSNHVQILCRTAPGSGESLMVNVTIGGQSVLGAFTISYAPPAVSTYLRKGAVAAATAGMEEVEIVGTNFGPIGTAINQASYGPNGSEFNASGCFVSVAHTNILCMTAPGAGSRLVWSLVVDNLQSVSPTTTYMSPKIIQISGPAAVDADTNGGQFIIIRGTDLGVTKYLQSVTYGSTGNEFHATNCSVTSPHTEITCYTVSGVGRRLRWIVNVGGQLSDPSTSTTSYQKPYIQILQPSSVQTSGGQLLTLAGAGFAANFKQADVRVLCDTGVAIARPEDADVALYWAAAQDGLSPPITVADRVRNWIASLTQLQVLQRTTDTSLLLLSPEGYGKNRTCFIMINDVPSNVITTLTFQDPVIQNVAPERTGMPDGYMRVFIDGKNFCRSTACGRLLVNGVQVDVVTWAHSQVEIVIAVPTQGASFNVQVVVGNQVSNVVDFSNPAPSFPANLNSQTRYDNMLTSGGQALQITAVTGITQYDAQSITIFVGQYAARDTKKVFQQGASETDPDALWTISATSPAGVGTNLPITLLTPGGRSRASAEFVFSYGAPRITSITTIAGAVVTDGGVAGISTFGSAIELHGVNFGSQDILNGTLDVALSNVEASLLSNPTIISISHTLVRISFPSGWGKGIQLSFAIAGQTSNVVQVGYCSPTIIALAPDRGSTVGGAVLRIRGTHWGSVAPAVKIDSKPCQNTGMHFIPSPTSLGLLDCVLPAGQGRNLPISITVGAQTTVSNVTYSYAVPTVELITPTSAATDGRAAGHFDDRGVYTPGSPIEATLLGSNFGTRDADITFIPDPAFANIVPAFIVNRTHITFQNDSMIRFIIPEGSGTAYSVRVTVSQQDASNEVQFEYDRPSILAWHRPDRPSTACGRYVRCFDVPTGWSTKNTTERCKDVFFDCYNTRGGYSVDIIGTSFGLMPARITIGGLLCPNQDAAERNHNKVSCIVPQGMGNNLPIVIWTAGRSSSPNVNATFSYDPPDLLSAMPSTPDSQGASLQLRGRNFGMIPNEVKVWVAGAECALSEWVNDGLLSCQLSGMPVGPKNVTVFAGNHSIMAFADEVEQIIVTKCTRGYAGMVGEHCIECRKELWGAECPGGELYFDLVQSLAGFWRSNVSTPDSRCHAGQQQRTTCPIFLACEPTNSCLGSNICADGYTGERCARCLTGKYYRVNGECVKCPNSPLAVVIVFLLAGLFAIFIAYLLHHYKISLALISIGIDYSQVVSMFGRTRISWPPEVREFLNVLSAFNVDLQLAAPECLIPEVSYGLKFAAVELLPAIVFGLLSIVYILDYARKRLCNDRRRADVHAALPTFVTLEISIMRVLYLYVTRTSLDVFSCSPTNPPDGKTYMAGYLEVPCNEPGGLHVTLLAPAVIALVLYSITLPLAAGLFMRTNRMTIKADQILRAKGLGDDKLTGEHLYHFRRMWHKLYYHFKPGKFYWELVLIARKFLIAFTSLMFRNSPSYQLSMALLVMFAAFAIHVRHVPYMSHKERPRIIAEHEAKVATNPIHARIEAELRAMLSKNPRLRQRSVALNDLAKLGARGGRRAQDIATLGILYVFDYNTVEAVLLACSVLLLLGGIMFDSSRFSADFGGFYNTEYASLTYSIMLLLSFSIVYFIVAFVVDLLLVCSPHTVANLCSRNNEPTSRRQPSKVITPQRNDADGLLHMAINPVVSHMLNDKQPNSTGGLANSISPADLSSMTAAPDASTWEIVKAAYAEQASTIHSLLAEVRALKLHKNTDGELLQGIQAPAQLVDLPRTASRREFQPTRLEQPSSDPRLLTNLARFRSPLPPTPRKKSELPNPSSSSRLKE